ncbi:hypothetical protein HJG60_010796 [Phyllostomus discolor]|uniref:Uncharacterized protein n=1 Tax=Phyllostomus discolor TaxID=89673 RepID=A0A834ADH4_9CHIR|nr:hypothetical protein HJG60_010796 [Phyllostomus discolor]
MTPSLDHMPSPMPPLLRWAPLGPTLHICLSCLPTGNPPLDIQHTFCTHSGPSSCHGLRPHLINSSSASRTPTQWHFLEEALPDCPRLGWILPLAQNTLHFCFTATVTYEIRYERMSAFLPRPAPDLRHLPDGELEEGRCCLPCS